MGTGCCTKLVKDSDRNELSILPGTSGISRPLILDSESAGRLGRSRTMARRERVILKTATDGVIITPSQFIRENQGVLSECYRFEKLLGEGSVREQALGSYGSVFLATHKKTNEKRAIKLIDKKSIAQGREGELVSEIKVLKEMDHPNIMKIYEFASDSRYYYLVQEYFLQHLRYITGGELFDTIIKRKCFGEQDAAFITRQVLSAITYCHSKGVVHRDLKPENILISSVLKDGKLAIKVIDFGAALFLAPNVSISEILGTPYYIAPEVLNGSYNEKCDVWSIGVILYILLSGTPPFNGATDEDIMNAVRKGTYRLQSKSTTNPIEGVWESVSESAKDLIRKMLEYDANKRISSIDAYKHQWFGGKDFSVLSMQNMQETIANMSKFYVVFLRNWKLSDKLQQAAMMYIATQLMSQKEKERLTAIFMALDKNGDGSLTKEELLEGYTRLYGNRERARSEVEYLMAVADVDKNELIDYSEFLLAAGNKKELTSQTNVKQAFDLFDIVWFSNEVQNKSGSISADEIKKVLGLGKRFSEDIWKEIIAQVDVNNDGEISYKEFQTMMNKFTT